MRNLYVQFLIPVLLSSWHLSAQPTEIYYLRANINEPWCCGWAPVANTNPDEMDAVFGAGGWNLDYYETAVAASVFNSNTCYVYMEGGDAHATEMETFFTANQTTIEDWVNDGGTLFMNAAPNEDNGMSFGFGGVSLVYPALISNVEVDPTATSHPIWSGPFLPVTTAMSAGYFAHGKISGGGTSPILKKSGGTPVVLSEKTWGLGRVFFGGMTVTGWHSPFTESSNLRKNMHNYLADMCNVILLPIEFSSFNAEIENERVRLNWETITEINNDYFTIERSDNLSDWFSIGIVDGAGTSTNTNQYIAFDEQPHFGVSYYRIRQTDVNGSYTFSEIRTILFNNEVVVYPVPANDFIDFSAIDADAYHIVLLNQMGERIDCDREASAETVRFHISDLPEGIYYLEFEDGARKEYRIFTKL